jgi:hypothetical protein
VSVVPSEAGRISVSWKCCLKSILGEAARQGCNWTGSRSDQISMRSYSLSLSIFIYIYIYTTIIIDIYRSWTLVRGRSVQRFETTGRLDFERLVNLKKAMPALRSRRSSRDS